MRGMICSVLLVLFSGVSSQGANVVFTFTGTSTTANQGFTVGQIVTLELTANGSYLTTGSPGLIQWFQETTLGSNAMWQNVVSTGLTGTYVDGADPAVSFTVQESNDYLSINLSTDVYPWDLGLDSPNGQPIGNILVNMTQATNWEILGGVTSIGGFFADYTGALNIGSFAEFSFSDSTASSNARFNITSASIALVPEPSTMALCGLGFMAFVVAGVRASRRRAA